MINPWIVHGSATQAMASFVDGVLRVSEASIFSSIARATALPLFDNGRPQGERIVKLLSLGKRDVARASRVPEGSVRYDLRMPSVLEEWLRTVATCIELVDSHFNNEERTVLWFMTPNPLLGDVKPLDYVKMGRVKKLLAIIQGALEDKPPK